jgi:two-component system sensor histidine kinase HydH
MNLPALSLRNKLLLFAAALVLIPGLVIGLLAERSGRESLQQVIGGQLAREAQHTADRISSVLDGERELLRSFALQDVMREIRVADIDKRIALSLVTLRDASPGRLDYLVVDGVGRVVAATSPELLGAEPGWARPGGRLPRAEREGIVLEAPVPDPDNPDAQLGRIVALLDWALLGEVTNGVKSDLADQGIAAELRIVDQRGYEIGPGGPSASDADLLPGIGAAGDYVVDANRARIVGRAPLAADLPGWTLLIAEPLSIALAPARQLRNRIALVVGLALATALAIAGLAGRRVTRPLSELSAAIRGLPRGDPAVLRVPVRTDDEVGALAATFNRMASELDRTQRNLVEAEKFAFVGELASGIAHEVRTSLGVLRSSAQILQRSLPTDDSGDAAELTQMIRAEVDRLAGVIDDLLTLDRPRPLHLEPTLVSRVVERAAEFVEARAREKKIDVRRRAVSNEVRVLCDQETIYQVAVNLMVNAVDALGRGGTVEVEVLEPHDGYAGFAVRDDGAGVPEALRDRIFQPFVTARDGGVGLGLTFVKRVVHEHQGRIFLEPGIGDGACFRVELPVVEVTR